jgi:hypothetical protein
MVLGNLGAILSNKIELQLYAQQKEGTALLEWNYSGNDLIYGIELERSKDGIRFVTIAKVRQTVHNATDTAMQTGANFYRIKTVMANGTVMYSNTVKLFKHTAGLMQYSVWPSIVQNKTWLHLYTRKKISLGIMLSDMQRRRIYQKIHALSEGNNTITIDCEALPAGMYKLAGFTEGQQILFCSLIKQ